MRRMMPETEWDRWAAIHHANRLYPRHGVTFAAFVEQPERYLDACLFRRPDTAGEPYRPLLPRQRAVQRALDAQALQATQP